MEQNRSRSLSRRCRVDAGRDTRGFIVRAGKQRLDLDRQSDDDGSVLAARPRYQGAAYSGVLLLGLRRMSAARTRNFCRDTVLGLGAGEAIHDTDKREHNHAEIKRDGHQIGKI